MKDQRGEQSSSSTISLSSAMFCVVNVTPQPFYPRELPVTHCIGAGFAQGTNWMVVENHPLRRDSIP